MQQHTHTHTQTHIHAWAYSCAMHLVGWCSTHFEIMCIFGLITSMRTKFVTIYYDYFHSHTFPYGIPCTRGDVHFSLRFTTVFIVTNGNLPLTYVRTETKLLYFSCIGFYSVAASSPEQLRVRLQPSNTKKAHAHTNCKLNYAYFNAFFMLVAKIDELQSSISQLMPYISQRSLNPK